MRRGRGGGSEGRGLHLRGSSGAALGVSRSVFPLVLRGLPCLSWWASRAREEEWEVAFGRGAGRGCICRGAWADEGAAGQSRAGRGARVLAPGGPSIPAAGKQPKAEGCGGLFAEGGSGGHLEPLPGRHGRERGPRWGKGCGRGVSGSEKRAPYWVRGGACLEAGPR